MKKIVFYMVLSLSLIGSVFAQLDVDEPLAEVNIDSEIYEIEWNAAGSVLAVASDDGFYLFDDDLVLLAHEYTSTTIYSVSWSPDGDALAITHEENIEIWQWDGAALNLIETLRGNQTQLVVAWSPDGTRLATINGLEGEIDWASTIHFWDVTRWEISTTVQGIYSIFSSVSPSNQIAWNPTGELEFVFLGDTLEIIDGNYFVEAVRQINFIDPTIGAISHFIPFIGSNASASAWRPQGDVIALGSDIDFGLYDAITGDYNLSSWMNEDFGNIILVYEPRAMDWTSDGRYLATSEYVYDYIENHYVGGFATPDGAVVWQVDWHPDNIRLATADSLGRIKIQNAALFDSFVTPSTSP